MEWLYALLFAALFDKLLALILTIIKIFFKILCVMDRTQVARLDREFGSNGFCSVRQSTLRLSPYYGYHILSIRTYSGLIIGIKSSQSYGSGQNVWSRDNYMIYGLCLKSGWDKFIHLLFGDQQLVPVHYVTALSPYDTCTDLERINVPSRLFPWQQKLIALITKEYMIQCDPEMNRATTVLVCGHKNMGKSEMAGLIVKHLRQIKYEASFIHGFEMTIKGLHLSRVLESQPTEFEPIVLLLDEIDCSFAFAEKETWHKSNGEASCLAQNRSRLLSYLDQLAKKRHFIVIATSNLTLAEMEKKYGFYMRNGRFNIKCCLYTQTLKQQMPTRDTLSEHFPFDENETYFKPTKVERKSQ